LIAEGWKTKKLSSISLKINSQSNKKKAEKIVGYESQNIIAKGFVFWIKRKLNRTKVEELCSNDKKSFLAHKSFEDYYTALRSQELIAASIENEYKYYAEKYLRILDASDALIHSNSYYNHEELLKESNIQNNKFSDLGSKPTIFTIDLNYNNNNFNNFNNSNNSNNYGNFESVNNKQLNPLIFSFENLNNNIFPNIQAPTKDSSSSKNHIRDICKNKNNNENECNCYRNNININDNKILDKNESLLINLFRLFSLNPDIRSSFENNLAENGVFTSEIFSVGKEINNSLKNLNEKNNLQKQIKINKEKVILNLKTTPVFNINNNSSNNNGTYNYNICNNITNNNSYNIPIIKNNKTNDKSSTIKEKFCNTNIYNNQRNDINTKKLSNNTAATIIASQNKNNKNNNNTTNEYSMMLNSKINKKAEEKFIEKKIREKEINLSMQTSKDFPIKIFHFIPFIHILSFTSSEFTKLTTLLCNDFLPFDSFPLKIDFPLGLSLTASLAITEFKSDVIQDISINDFQKENNNLHSTSNIQNDKYLKDLSSNANHSTALLDDKYAQEFYDKYFQERNVGVFSEFSEESFNRDNLLRGSKTNYSELFRDEEFPGCDINKIIDNNNNLNVSGSGNNNININYNIVNLNNNNGKGNSKGVEKRDINEEYILTELKNEDEEIVFKNKLEKNNRNRNDFFNLKVNNNEENNKEYGNGNYNNCPNYECLGSEISKQPDNFKEERGRRHSNTSENSTQKKQYSISIATNEYKNKKIGNNKIILSNKQSDSRRDLSNKSNNNYNKENLQNNYEGEQDTIELSCNQFISSSSISYNNNNILNAKKIIIKKKVNHQPNTDNNRQAAFRIHNINNTNYNLNRKIKVLLSNQKKKENKLNEESIVSFSNISDFEKTLEENATLNISKYTQNLKYNKPPEFKQRLKSDIKISSEKQALRILHNYSSSDADMYINKLSADNKNANNNINFSNIGSKRDFIDSQSQFSSGTAVCNKDINTVTNINVYSNNNDRKLLMRSNLISNNNINTNNNVSGNFNNNTISIMEFDRQAKSILEKNNCYIYEKNKQTLINNPYNQTTIKDNINSISKSNNTNHINITNNADNKSIYIPAAELNNYYIPTYSNAEMENNDFDKNSSILEKSYINNNDFNKTEKGSSLNLQNYNNLLFNSNNENYIQKANFDNAKHNLQVNKGFIMTFSDKINQNNTNIISNESNSNRVVANNNEFFYDNLNKDHLNFDTISLCVRNENNSENNKRNPYNNKNTLSIHNRIERISKKLYEQPGKMIRKESKKLLKPPNSKKFETINYNNTTEAMDAAENNVNLLINTESARNTFFTTLVDDKENDENNFLQQYDESNPLEKTVFNKISNMKILPIKLLSRNFNNGKNLNLFLSEGVGDVNYEMRSNYIHNMNNINNNLKKRNLIPKYCSRDK